LISEIIRELTNRSEDALIGHSVIITVGDNSGTDHCFVTLRYRKANVKYFVKMARSPRVSGRIRDEVNVLKKLKELGAKNIPELVLDGLSERRMFLVEKLIEGSPLSRSPFSGVERLHKRLSWLKGFYAETSGAGIEGRELIRRAEKVAHSVDGLADLTKALSLLETLTPETKIPTVCWHGDAYDVNFISTRSGVVAVDFSFARFDEPPAEPFALVPANTLTSNVKDLDYLSVLDRVSPFFLATYQCIIRLGDEIQLHQELEEDLLLINKLTNFPMRELGKLESLLSLYRPSN
jgi:hypothetical protein